MWRGGEAGITERGLTSAVSAASPRPASSLLCLLRQEVEILGHTFTVQSV